MMGSFHDRMAMPAETHVGYVEGYLDALEKIETYTKRYPEMSIEDITKALWISMKATIVNTEAIKLPEDLHCFPSTKQLLKP